MAGEVGDGKRWLHGTAVWQRMQEGVIRVNHCSDRGTNLELRTPLLPAFATLHLRWARPFPQCRYSTRHTCGHDETCGGYGESYRLHIYTYK